MSKTAKGDGRRKTGDGSNGGTFLPSPVFRLPSTEYALFLGRITAERMRPPSDPILDLEDLTQVGQLGALRAMATFEPGKGVWRTWIINHARWAIKEELRRFDHATRGERRRAHESGEPLRERPVSLEEAHKGNEPRDEGGWEDAVLARVVAREALADLSRVRPEEGEALREYFLRGRTYHGIAREIGRSPSRVKQRVGQGVRWLSRWLSEDEE